MQWLLSRGYTPVEAAEKLGVSPSHVRKVLRGTPDRGNALKARIKQLPCKQLTALRRSK